MTNSQLRRIWRIWYELDSDERFDRSTEMLYVLTIERAVKELGAPIDGLDVTEALNRFGRSACPQCGETPQIPGVPPVACLACGWRKS